MRALRLLGDVAVTAVALGMIIALLIMGALFVFLAASDANVVRADSFVRLPALLYGLMMFSPALLVSLFLRLHRIDPQLHDTLVARWHKTPGAFIVCVPNSQIGELHRAVRRIATTPTLPPSLRRYAAFVWHFQRSVFPALLVATFIWLVKRAIAS